MATRSPCVATTAWKKDSNHSNTHDNSKQGNHSSRDNHISSPTRTTSKLDRHSNAGNRGNHSFMFFAICSAPLSCWSLSQVLMFRVTILVPSSNTTVSQTCSPKYVTPTRACCLCYQGQLVEHWTHVIQVSLSCKIIPSAITSCDEKHSLC